MSRVKYLLVRRSFAHSMMACGWLFTLGNGASLNGSVLVSDDGGLGTQQWL